MSPTSDGAAVTAVVSDGRRTALTGGSIASQPVFSPDGSRILYESEQATASLPRGFALSYCLPIGDPVTIAVRVAQGMGRKADVWQGTLALMVLKTLEAMGPLHGYGIARRIEQTSGRRLVVNYGTIYPALLKLEQEGYLASGWGVSDNQRRAKFYRLTPAGRRQLEKASREWREATDILDRFLSPERGS